MATPASALVGYAVLRSNYNENARTYLENFQPFILSVLASTTKKFLTKQEIADTIRDRFGISIPVHVVAKLARRMNNMNVTVSVGQDAFSITAEGRKDAAGISEEVVLYQKKQNELVNEFQKFVRENYPGHIEMLSEDLGTALAKYFDRHAAPLLNQRLRGRTRLTSVAQGLDFLVSAFVHEIAENDQVRFEYVVEAAKGAMLASVLVLDISGLADSLNRLSIVLDTPVIMDALGFHGEIPEAAAEQVLALARSQGARLVTFEHVVGEIEGILESIEHALRPGHRSRSTAAGFLHFVEAGYTPVDVALLRGRLGSMLNKIEVETIARPDGYYQYGLDETELEKVLQEKVNYSQDAARINDVFSLSAVQRLRRGTRDKAIERCRIVMVTSNSNLVGAAIEFDKGNKSFPLAITVEALASILWVRTPAATSDVPKQVLLASAFAGMQPDAHLWSLYLDEIDKLEASHTVTPDEAIVLRSHQVSRESLMEETLGNPDALTLESPIEALERIKKEVAEPLEQKLSLLTQETTEATKVAEHASVDWMKQAEAREEAEKRVAHLESIQVSMEHKIDKFEKQEHDRRQQIHEIAKSRAQKRRKRMQGGLRLVAGFVVLTALLVFVTIPQGKIGATIGGAAGILSILLPLLPKPQEWFDRWQSRVQGITEKRLLENAGFNSVTADGMDRAGSSVD